MKVVLASRNAHKLEEIRRMRPDIEWVALPAHLPDPPETGDTFLDNALEKARFVRDATGLPSLADDSGLAVDFLGGAPGVFSKRFSPEQTDAANNALLLQKLDGVTARSARYVCVLAVAFPSEAPAAAVERTVEGTCEGTIGHAPRGSGGFGYDPLFLPAAFPGRTMAELRPEEKDAISHRGAAMAHLDALLAPT